MYDAMLQALIALANTTGVNVMVGTLPPDNGISMAAQGGVTSVALNNGGLGTLNVVLNGKNANQQTVISQLEAIHTLLTRRQDFPAAGIWQIYSVTTVASPRIIGREQNSQYLYGSSLAVKFSERGID